MIPQILPLVLAWQSAAMPTVETSNPIRVTSASIPSGVDADGDTAYLCDQKHLRKLVLQGRSIKTVDSTPLPTTRSWDRSRYVALADGLGILAAAYSSPGSAQNDSTIWMVDWKVPASDGIRRWKPFPALGPVHASNRTIEGVRLSATTAAIARTEGLFLASVLVRKSTGKQDSLVLERPKNVPVDPYWEAISMDSTGIVAKSTTSNMLDVWNVPNSSTDPVSGFAAIELQGMLQKPRDLLPKAPPGIPAPLRVDASRILSMENTDSVLYRWRRTSGTTWSISDSMRLFGQRIGESLPLETTRSGFGLYLFSGMTSQLLLSGEPGSDPFPIAQLPGGLFQGTAFGTTALWQATSSSLAAYPIRMPGTSVVAPSRSTSTWKASARSGALRLEGSPGSDVRVFDAAGQQLGRFSIDASGVSDLVVTGGRPILVRCDGATRSLFVPR